MTTPEYNVSQPALYLICRILLDNCGANIATFADKKAMYTATWCTNLESQINAAAALPDDQTRSLNHEQLRLQMIQKGNACCEMWQYAKSYIRTAFPNLQERQINWDAAGMQYYEAASHQNWSALDVLNRTCLIYINDNLTLLTMGGTNMPSQFLIDFTFAKQEWFELYLQFISARQTARTGTQTKVEANNAIYRTIIDTICSDGQLYFRSDDEMRKQFSFEAIAELVVPSGASAAIITVQNAQTGQPLIADVIEEATDRTLTTDADGRCEFGNLSAGTKIFTITVDGYTPQPISINLKTGTTSRITAQMEPMFAGAGSKKTNAVKPEMSIISVNGPSPEPPSAFS